ncbi:MAG: outer membrane lipoprotein chaperone LolA [Pseudomonadales bacterium]
MIETSIGQKRCVWFCLMGIAGLLFQVGVTSARAASVSDPVLVEGIPYTASTDLADRALLRERLAELRVYAANFVQSVYGSSGEVLEESEGYVRLRRPDFKWVVAAPYPQIIVTSGNRIQIYDPDLEQVTMRPLDEALSDTPVALLTRDDVVLGQDFSVARVTEPEGERFLLGPRSEDSLYRQIILTFAKNASGAAGLIGLDIVDQLGQRTEIRFEHADQPTDVDPSEFVLELPEGTDIVGE